LCLASKDPATKNECDVLDPILAVNTLPLIVMLPLLSFAAAQSTGLTSSGSQNFRYLVTPAADECPQYCEKTDSTTWHLNIGTVRSLFCCMISAEIILLNRCSKPLAWHGAGSSRLYASTMLLEFEQSYAMNAVTGVTIMTQAIIVIIIMVMKGYPLITLAINPLLLADNPRLLFQPPPNAPWYSRPPVRRLFHN
jgi:hypothetical protein